MEISGEYLLTEDLVRRIRGGDRGGTEELYSTLSGAAMPKLSRTVDSQLVEDKFHDIVVTVLEAIQNGSLREPARLMGFAQTVTRRRVATHIRGKISRRSRLVQIGAVDFPAPAADSPEAASIKAQRLGVLRGAMQKLCSRDRKILASFYYQEETPQEICGQMGLTSTQFRLYKSRALARCAEYVRSGTARRIGR
jgi:RNA polymerase sigma factor (sigma-70 family)